MKTCQACLTGVDESAATCPHCGESSFTAMTSGLAPFTVESAEAIVADEDEDS